MKLSFQIPLLLLICSSVFLFPRFSHAESCTIEIDEDDQSVKSVKPGQKIKFDYVGTAPNNLIWLSLDDNYTVGEKVFTQPDGISFNFESFEINKNSDGSIDFNGVLSLKPQFINKAKSYSLNVVVFALLKDFDECSLKLTMHVQDCDSLTYYLDADADGLGGDLTKEFCPLETIPSNYVSNSDDCDDDPITGKTIGFPVFYLDYDGDGCGNPNLNEQSCTKPAGSYVTNGTDCNDNHFDAPANCACVLPDPEEPEPTDPTEPEEPDPDAPTPENTLDACDNGVDDDQDGFPDCADAECKVFLNICDPSSDLSLKREVCANGIDDNGDGKLDCDDDDCVDSAACDDDEDDYCEGVWATATQMVCGKKNGKSAQPGDCNDDDFNTSPGVFEFCGDCQDNNCDGNFDESCLNLNENYINEQISTTALITQGSSVKKLFDGAPSPTASESDDDTQYIHPSCLSAGESFSFPVANPSDCSLSPQTLFNPWRAMLALSLIVPFFLVLSRLRKSL